MGTTVGDLMTSPAVVVQLETSLEAVAATLLRHEVSGVPVVDAEWRLAGVVSEADLLPHEAYPSLDEDHALIGGLLQHGVPAGSEKLVAMLEKATAGTAADVMSAPAVCITEDRPAQEAAELMRTSNVKRLPVVDRSGRVKGMITRRDLLRLLAG
jgi:CBS domain-containing protein